MPRYIEKYHSGSNSSIQKNRSIDHISISWHSMVTKYSTKKPRIFYQCQIGGNHLNKEKIWVPYTIYNIGGLDNIHITK